MMKLARMPILLLLVAAVLLTIAGGSLGAQPAVTVMLPEITLELGETAEIIGVIDCPSRECSGYEITIVFDPTVIQVDAAVPGAFMGAAPVTPPRGNTIDNQTGVVQLTAVRGVPPSATENRLFSLTVTGIGDGVSPLAILEISITGRGASRLDAVGMSGSVTVSGSPTLTLGRTLVARMGPGSAFDITGELPAGVSLAILGISADGAWFYVELPDGSVAWLANAPQFLTTTGNLADLPIISADAQSAPTLTLPAAIPTLGGTNTPIPTLAPSLTPIPTETLTPTITNTPEPCRVVANTRNVVVRVGPDPNRTGRATLTPNREYGVRGQATGADGQIWYNVEWDNTAEPDRYWVAASDVTARGGCDAARAVPTSMIVIAPPTAAPTQPAVTSTVSGSPTRTITGTPPTATRTITGTPPTATTAPTLDANSIDCSTLTLFQPRGSFVPSSATQFFWSAVPGAIKYRVTVSNNGSWIIFQTEALSTGAQINLANAVSDPRWSGQIAWTVQAIRSGSGASEIRCESAAVVAFAAPTPMP